MDQNNYILLISYTIDIGIFKVSAINISVCPLPGIGIFLMRVNTIYVHGMYAPMLMFQYFILSQDITCLWQLQNLHSHSYLFYEYQNENLSRKLIYLALLFRCIYTTDTGCCMMYVKCKLNLAMGTHTDNGIEFSIYFCIIYQDFSLA